MAAKLIRTTLSCLILLTPFLAVGLYSDALGAQTAALEVIVTDAATGKPLTFAIVEIYGAINVRGATGAQGVVTFNGVPPGEYEITANETHHFPGMAKAAAAARGRTTIVTMRLKATAINSSAALTLRPRFIARVTATPRPQPLNIDKATDATPEVQMSNSLSEVLGTLPGAVIQNSDNGASASIGGHNADQTSINVDGESASDLYHAAINNMAALREPPYIVYRLKGKPADRNQPLHMGLAVHDNLVWISSSETDADTTWYVVHRTSDFDNAILDQDGTEYLSDRSFFDPTWDGAYHALHDGMFFLYPFFSDHQPQPQPISTQQPAVTGGPKTIASVRVPAPGLYKVQGIGNTGNPALSRKQTQTPAPVPQQTPLTSNLKTIALITVMGAAIYDIEDRGAATCSNGDPARALHLTARTSPERHQLTDVLIDLNFIRFCMVRFGAPGSSQRSVELHYGPVAGFWMQTDGVVSVMEPVRSLGMSEAYQVEGFVRRRWVFQLDILSYPATVPQGVF